MNLLQIAFMSVMLITLSGEPALNNADISYIDVQELQMNGMQLGISEKEFFQILGKDPLTKQESEIIEGELYDITYTFSDGLEALLVLTDQSINNEYHLLSLRATSPSYSTIRGLKPSDPVSKLISLYGKPYWVNEDVWMYCSDEEASYTYYEITVKNGAVTEIYMILPL